MIRTSIISLGDLGEAAILNGHQKWPQSKLMFAHYHISVCETDRLNFGVYTQVIRAIEHK